MGVFIFPSPFYLLLCTFLIFAELEVTSRRVPRFPLFKSPKAKVEILSHILKQRVEALKHVANRQIELVFLIDSSASVGEENFFNELKFVRKLLADFTVAPNDTRVAVITFSSKNRIIRHVDHLSGTSLSNQHKCSLLIEDLSNIKYTGGGTYTMGALLEAQQVLTSSRPQAVKAVFLITDGYSNGGDPRPAARTLRLFGVEVFTFGIRNGNVQELYDMASKPQHHYSFILNSFQEFEALARRALHQDLQAGTYLEQKPVACSNLCFNSTTCCDHQALCACGTHSGHYACVCPPGYFGSGLQGDCNKCPPGTFRTSSGPGDITLCTPCPDQLHQVSKAGSTSVEQCVCKKGYRQKNHHCILTICPILTPPQHGYFIGSKCTNSFNAACGIQCSPGYQLKGSSIRLCQENGTWSGENTKCVMKNCPVLLPPKHGKMICTTKNPVFETSCKFMCDEGYTLVGSRKRTCLAVSLWDGLPGHCRAIFCHPLQRIANGIITPEYCTSHKAEYNTTCQYLCHQGYTLNGPSSNHCISPGIWSNEKNQSVCLDLEPPYIKCPKNIIAVADDNDNIAKLHWNYASAEDNDDPSPSIISIPVVVFPAEIPIGIFTITYVAEDQSGNKAECYMNITVLDTQRPGIDKCVSPSPFLLTDKNIFITWEEPTFSDNSKGKLVVNKSHEPGIFPYGDTEIIYSVQDEAGNQNNCTITITVQKHACEMPSAPIHGNVHCVEENDGVYCTLTCDQGFGFAVQPPINYFCAYNGIWLPSDNLMWPDCSGASTSTTISQFGILSFQSENIPCDDSYYLHQLEYHIVDMLNEKMYCHVNITCDVSGYIVDCDETIISSDESTSVQWPKKQNKSPNPAINMDTKTFTEELLKLKRVLRSYVTSEIGRSHDNIVDFDPSGEAVYNLTNEGVEVFGLKTMHVHLQFTGSVDSDLSYSVEDSQSVLFYGIKNFTKSVEVIGHAGELDLILQSYSLSYKDLYTDDSNIQFECEAGTMLQGTDCVQCPVGTFYSLITEICEPCEKGKYQFQEKQLLCIDCPENTSTYYEHSKNLSDCLAKCSPGRFSSSGLEPCEKCGKGYYQPKHAAKSCLPCPENMTTSGRNTANERECRRYCSEGTVSNNGISPCYPCPAGYFQLFLGRTFCYRCPQNVTTHYIGSTSITACAGYEEVTDPLIEFIKSLDVLHMGACFFQPCENRGSCQLQGFGYVCHCLPGYTGEHCDFDIDDCFGNPCLNNGTCFDKLNAFECVCSSGFAGNTCDTDIDECALLLPCLNGGVCIDQVDGFFCNCANGFQGYFCEVDTDECISNPCLNNGQCKDLISTYSCICQDGFTGHHCETNIDECAKEPCLNNATCHDDINSFECTCLHGYVGHKCDTDVDECALSPCLNGGTCIDGRGYFQCICPPSFSGFNCDSELSSDFILEFTSAGTMDRSHLKATAFTLNEFTLCLWIQTSDKFNYGTPFSYSTDMQENTLTLTDYNGFVVYVNGDKVITDVVVNDGKWHMICVSWTSENGTWNIYKDGHFEDGGSGLATNSSIPGQGIIILGQEQDTNGGGFSAAESFIGSVTLLNLWSSMLNSESIQHLANTCEPYKGNLYSWPDFMGGLHGRVLIKSGIFCKGCDPLNDPPSHGKLNTSGLQVGTVTIYSCDEGFKLKGDKLRHCLLHGNWSGNIPSCERVNCGFPGYLINGHIHGRSYNFGDVVQYICNKGYNLIGTEFRQCQKDGTWNAIEATCEEISCENPIINMNGEIVSILSMFHPGDQVEFKCHDGYILEGAHTILCNDIGVWNHNFPTCEPLFCNELPLIENGYVINNDEKAIIGKEISFACFAGYVLVGSSTLYCSSNLKWNDTMPQCLIVDCGDPPKNQHADIHFSLTVFNSSAYYSCHIGYKPKHKVNTIFCTSDGNWGGNVTCEPVKCSRPKRLKHGKFYGSYFHFKSTIIYMCDIGFELNGENVHTCLATGEWNAPKPFCEAITCQNPLQIAHAQVNESSPWIVGKSVRYVCNPGYEHAKVYDSPVCLENGTWNYTAVPSCQPIVCSKPKIMNGFITGDNYEFGHYIHYRCKNGYNVEGESSAKCAADGTWHPSVPKCIEVLCEPLNNPENGLIFINSFTYNSTVQYNCVAGFKLQGNSKRTCLENGSWSYEEPTCKTISCEPPDYIKNGVVEIESLLFGSEVKYSCTEGYMLIGSSGRTCNSTGFWSGNVASCIPINCSIIPFLLNGVIRVRSLTVNSTAEFYCDEGYEMIGSSKITCLKDGTWNNNFPECIPINCVSMKHIDFVNGHIIEPTDLVFGSLIQFECKPGYILTGPQTMRCLSNKTWGDDQPVCEKISCGVPTQIQNGLHIDGNYSFGDTVWYTCEKGYELSGFTMISCLANESWSYSNVSCNPVQCPPVLAPLNGRIININLSFEGQIIFQCDEGYTLIGSSVLICQLNKTWSYEQPQCNPVQCPEPVAPDNGILQYEHRNIGSIIKYACNAGFEATESTNNFYQQCLSSGEWSAELPACKPITCPIFTNSFPNGYVKTSSNTINSTLHFKCEEGYHIIGMNYSLCQLNGEWSQPYPICSKITCPSLSVIKHGTIVANDFAFLSTVEFFCDPGYVLNGKNKLFCTSNGTWSGKIPFCKSHFCPTVKFIDNGAVIGNDFSIGKSISFVCNDFYYLDGETTLHCLHTQMWSSAIPNCKQSFCTIPKQPRNGQFVLMQEHHNLNDSKLNHSKLLSFYFTNSSSLNSSGARVSDYQENSFTVGTILQFQCYEGYTSYLGLHYQIQCIGHQKWNDTVPECSSVVCYSPVQISDDSLQSLFVFNYNETIEYACDNGSILVGNHYQRCLENGSWSGNPPKCEKIQCLKLKPISHGIYLFNESFVGAEAVIECETGYQHVGPISRVCTISGAWSEPEPSCEPVSCPTPTEFSNGSIYFGSTEVGSILTFSCYLGFELIGSSVLTCLLNGSWSAAYPYCQETKCPNITPVENSEIHYSGKTYGSFVQYICKKGFEHVGNLVRLCQLNKTWSGDEPTCIPLVCPKPNIIRNGYVVGSSYAVGSVIHNSCNNGYKLLGSEVQKCEIDQRWSGQEPECFISSCSSITQLLHGTVFGNTFSVGSALHFACNYGFDMKGSNYLICMSHEQWSDEIPVCLKSYCSNPPHVKHADVSAISFAIGSKIYYHCKPGFRLTDGEFLYCNNSAMWEGFVPKCVEITCDTPPLVLYASITFYPRTNVPKFGTRAMYSCMDGYVLEGDASMICTEIGNWNGNVPSCIHLSCGTPPNIRAASIVLANSNQAVYDCNAGYVMVGNVHLLCLPSGVWDIKRPQCIPLLCGDPPTIHDGNVHIRNHKHFTEAVYTCSAGFHLVSNGTLICTTDGIWIGHNPHCLPIVCTPPAVLSNGLITGGTEFTYKSVIFYSCEQGYELLGNEARFCQADGTWSGSEPYCARTHCEKLQSPNNGRIIVSGYEPDSTAKVECHEGFKLIGVYALHCLRNGEWNAPVANCSIITCKPPPLLDSVTDFGHDKDFSFGDQITYVCQKGFHATQDMTIHCTNDGKWLQPKGHCIRRKCSKPITRNGAIILGGTSYFVEDRVTFICPTGKRARNYNVLTCLDDGTWDKEAICDDLCSKQCLNNGTCVHPGKCSCPNGYVGEYCQYAVCSIQCLNGGSCSAADTCSCLPGYTGQVCENFTCHPPCENGGRCVSPNFCQCKSGYFPPLCQK